MNQDVSGDQEDFLQVLEQSFKHIHKIVPAEHHRKFDEIRDRTFNLIFKHEENREHHQRCLLASRLFSELLWSVFKDCVEQSHDRTQQLERVRMHYRTFICLLDEFKGDPVRIPEKIRVEVEGSFEYQLGQ